MQNTRRVCILLLFILAPGMVRAQYIQTPQPYWYVVGAGALAARPATCTANWHVWICNGAGCTTNGEYHYCTALNTWTIASGADDFVKAASALTIVSAVPRVTAAGTIGDSLLTVSASPVTATLYDSTAVTGATTLAVRAGAGQGAVPLQYWRNAAGVAMAFVGTAGQLSTSAVVQSASAWYLQSTGIDMGNAVNVRWSSTAIYSGAADLGLSRGAAGLLQINSGVAGTLRDLQFRKSQWNNDAEPACNAANRGYVVMVQGAAGVADTFRICSKDALDAYAWRALY